jgi:hypothetical protein
MFLALMIFGAGWLVFALLAWRANRMFAASPSASPKWRAAYRCWWLPGLLLGVASVFIAFPYTTSERYVVHGFPFPAYAFDSMGHDYVGVMTLPFMAINFACWTLAIHVALWLAARYSVR